VPVAEGEPADEREVEADELFSRMQVAPFPICVQESERAGLSRRRHATSLLRKTRRINCK
jgi:hypothetical protein